jgi:hypothetical protein
MPIPPVTDAAERERALGDALAARRARAHFKGEVAAGRLTLAGLFDKGRRGQSDEVGEHMRLVGRIKAVDALTAVRGIGQVTAARICGQAGVAPSTHLDQLSVAARSTLLECARQTARVNLDDIG